MDFYENEKNTSYTPTDFSDFSDIKEPNPFVGAVPITDENTLLGKVFKWMTIGLGISAISAFIGTDLVLRNVLTFGMFVFLLIAELILVLVFSLNIKKMSAGAATACFIAYAIINGLTLSTVLLIYTSSSVISAFFVAAAMFGGAALYGKTTQKDLTSMGSFLLMALLGLIVAGIVNLLVRSSMLDFIICVVGIVVFIGLTAYDVNKIREFARVEGLYNEENVKKVAIWGALQLYLDFINIFLKILRLMGKRKN